MRSIENAAKGSFQLGIVIGTALLAWLAPTSAMSSDCPTDRCPIANNEPSQTQCTLGPTAALPLSPDRDLQITPDDITATAASTDYLANGNVDASGGIELRQGQRVLRTEAGHRDGATGDWTIPGAVEFSDPNLAVSGSGARITENGAAEFDDTHFKIPARAGHGSAEQIRLTKAGELQLRNVRYTTCAGPKPDWELKVDSLYIDAQAREGAARNARINFKGVPILYTPYISFPVGNERKSGFLFPSLGNSSRSGTQLAVPWYWNIAPNYDLTFTPTWYSERGVDLGTESRYLTERSHGTLQFNYLPNDQQKEKMNRSFVDLVTQTNFTSQLRFDAAGTKVSDNSWLEDIGNGTQPTGVTVLSRWAQMTYRSDEWRVAMRAQNYQTIDDEIAVNELPYAVLPQIVFEGFFPNRFYGLDYAFNGEIANFVPNAPSAAPEGQRLDLYPEVRLPLRHGSLYVEPIVAWRYTAYRLDDAVNASNQPSPSRSAPIFSIDSGIAFERASGSDRQRLQTLEPRLLYLYVPYRDQDTLPVFDTKLPDFNLIQLFRANRYVGADRLGDANQLAAGVTTRLLDAGNGYQFLSATIGQIYRFSTPRVALPGELPDTNRSSDFIGELELTAYKNWNARLGVQWDPVVQRFERKEIGVQYRPESGQVINVGYRFRQARIDQTGQVQLQELKQADTSFAWPVGNRISLYGRFVYSLNDDKLIENDDKLIERMIGIEYRDCCWGLRFFTRRTVSLTKSTETSWQIQIELKGLSNVGNRVDTFLAQSIRGYSAARLDNDRYGPPSR